MGQHGLFGVLAGSAMDNEGRSWDVGTVHNYLLDPPNQVGISLRLGGGWGEEKEGEKGAYADECKITGAFASFNTSRMSTIMATRFISHAIFSPVGLSPPQYAPPGQQLSRRICCCTRGSHDGGRIADLVEALDPTVSMRGDGLGGRGSKRQRIRVFSDERRRFAAAYRART